MFCLGKESLLREIRRLSIYLPRKSQVKRCEIETSLNIGAVASCSKCHELLYIRRKGRYSALYFWKGKYSVLYFSLSSVSSLCPTPPVKLKRRAADALFFSPSAKKRMKTRPPGTTSPATRR